MSIQKIPLNIVSNETCDVCNIKHSVKTEPQCNKTVPKPVPIELDFKDIRLVRQHNNNKLLFDIITANDIDLEAFYKNINIKEFERTLKDLQLSKQDFFTKCQNDHLFCKMSARTISKNASRQCTKDETEQLRVCNFTSEKCGVFINSLSSREIRPTKDGTLVSNDDMKKNKIQKDRCLKSFDASLSGRMIGFISSKISFGGGGHQDNVVEEQETFAEWWKSYKSNTNDMLIILIDTDLKDKFLRIKEKYNHIQNIMVCNHVELQKYIIDKYYSCESI
jgi:hypothetical protein